MIVWGGGGGSGHINTGGRYNPATDSWILTSTTNAPAGREQHTAVWTGNEMIVWGGASPSGRFNTGGRYNPATDSWIATNTANAPSARQQQTAIWTGSEMIVWGGFDNSFSLVNTGVRYNPMADSWTTMSVSGAPTGRSLHTAIWTSSEMIVWGGQGNPNLNTGGRYCQGPPNNAPVARCQNVTVTADATNTAPASINNGSFDPDGDPLALTQAPAGPYPVRMTSVMLTVTDGRGGSSTCSAAVTVTAFGQPPGDPAPSGPPPTKGSVLIYNYYASDPINPTLENTTIELTNHHPSATTIAHLFFIDGNSCAPADMFACLAPGETQRYLVSDLDPGNKGYVAVFSTDGDGVPNKFNFLSGSAVVKLASGHEAEFAAVAIPAIAAIPATAELISCCGYVAKVRFDGSQYARVPRVLELDPVYSAGDGAETILAVNSLSGNLLTGMTAIGAFQGVLTNHNTGSQFTFTSSAGCRINQLLSNTFPLTSPVFSTALPAKDEGNLKLWANADQGISGALLNYNSKKKGKKFNSDDNLRATTVTSSTLIVPVFPPSC